MQYQVTADFTRKREQRVGIFNAVQAGGALATAGVFLFAAFINMWLAVGLLIPCLWIVFFGLRSHEGRMRYEHDLAKIRVALFRRVATTYRGFSRLGKARRLMVPLIWRTTSGEITLATQVLAAAAERVNGSHHAS